MWGSPDRWCGALGFFSGISICAALFQRINVIMLSRLVGSTQVGIVRAGRYFLVHSYDGGNQRQHRHLPYSLQAMRSASPADVTSAAGNRPKLPREAEVSSNDNDDGRSNALLLPLLLLRSNDLPHLLLRRRADLLALLSPPSSGPRASATALRGRRSEGHGLAGVVAELHGRRIVARSPRRERPPRRGEEELELELKRTSSPGAPGRRRRRREPRHLLEGRLLVARVVDCLHVEEDEERSRRRRSRRRFSFSLSPLPPCSSASSAPLSPSIFIVRSLDRLHHRIHLGAQARAIIPPFPSRIPGPRSRRRGPGPRLSWSGRRHTLWRTQTGSAKSGSGTRAPQPRSSRALATALP